jgi:hypothetical protein
VQARTTAIAREFRELIKRLKSEGDTAGLDIVNRLINVETARARLDQLRQEEERALSRMKIAEDDLTAAQQNGAIGEIAAQRQIIALHKQTSDALLPIIERMRQVAAAIGPEAVAQVEQLAAQIRRLGEEVDPVARDMNKAFHSDLTDALAEFIDHTHTGAQAFTDFANSIIRDLARIAAKQFEENLFGGTNLAGFFGIGGGSSGSAGASGGGAIIVAPESVGQSSNLSLTATKGSGFPPIKLTSAAPFPSGSGAGGVKVMVENKGTPIQATGDTQVGFDPDGMVVRIVTQDVQRGGPISGSLARAFGLRRTAK